MSANKPYIIGVTGGIGCGKTEAAAFLESLGAARVDAEVNDLIKSAHDKAREVLTKDRHAMDVLAGFLLERETITGAEFMDLLGKVDSGKA